MAKGKEILRGRVGSPGTYVGTVRVVGGDESKMATIQPGEIMVCEKMVPKHLPYMQKAGAFIADLGGPTSGTAQLAKELGRPCAVGTKEATTLLHDGQNVVVEGNAGLEDWINPYTKKKEKRPYSAVYEYLAESPQSSQSALADRMEALAKAKGISLPPEVLAKLRKGGGSA